MARRPAARRAGGINLSSRPFVNSRPVVRATVLLWLFGALLVLWAGSRFFGYYAGQADQRQEIARIEEQMAGERRTIVALESQLAALAPDNQNERVAFLNRRIAERTFSWSLLFDHLAAVLPDNVRLLSLAPQFSLATPRSGGRANAPSGGPATETLVGLNIQGVAKSSEDILSLIDALFADAAFDRPNPHQESRQGNETSFSLSVVYRPAVDSSPEADAEPDAEIEPEIEPGVEPGVEPAGEVELTADVAGGAA